MLNFFQYFSDLQSIKIEHIKRMIKFNESCSIFCCRSFNFIVFFNYLYRKPILFRIFCGMTGTFYYYNPFLAVSNLYPQKTSENLCFSSVFRGYKMGTMARNGLNEILFRGVSQ